MLPGKVKNWLFGFLMTYEHYGMNMHHDATI